MRSNYCEPPLCCTLKITHDVWPDCSDRRRTSATLTRFWRSITDTRPRIWGAGLKQRDYPQQFLDVSPFQALTIEHLCLSNTIDLDEKLFAREPCLNRRASGPL